MLNYEKLFEPYTGDGNKLENAIRFLNKTAANRGIGPDIVELAINEIFSELASGKEYPKRSLSLWLRHRQGRYRGSSCDKKQNV